MEKRSDKRVLTLEDAEGRLDLAYRDQGRGEPLLLLHGFFGERAGRSRQRIPESQVEENRGGHERHAAVAGLEAVPVLGEPVDDRIREPHTEPTVTGEHHGLRPGRGGIHTGH